MRDPHLTANAIHHEWLRILYRAGAGRRVTGVSNRTSSLQPGQFFLPENLRHQTHVFVHEETGSRSIATNDPGALLSTMLQREQTIIRQHGSVRMTEHAEKPALVLRQSGRVWHLVRIWSVQGASHTE